MQNALAVYTLKPSLKGRKLVEIAREHGNLSAALGKLRQKKSSGAEIRPASGLLRNRGNKYTFTDCPEFHAMQTTQPPGTWPTATLVRWGARFLSVPILLFWGSMLIAHLWGEEGRPSRPLLWQDAAILTTLVVSLVGLAVAWKWDLAGGALTLTAISICAVFNWKVLSFPGTLIPVAALMYLACGWMSRAPRHESAASPQ